MDHIPFKTYINVHTQNQFYEDMYVKYPELLIYTRKQIKEMLIAFNRHTIDRITSTREGVILPMYMGAMFLGTYGRKDNTIDKTTSRAIGKEVTFTAHESDGYGGMLYYITAIVKDRFKDGKYWAFIPDRRAAMNVAKAHRENWKKFVHVSNQKYASKVFKSAILKEYAKKKTAEAQLLYNEFDFD